MVKDLLYEIGDQKTDIFEPVILEQCEQLMFCFLLLLLWDLQFNHLLLLLLVVVFVLND